MGLTGGIASGKSVVAQAWSSEPDVAVVDADQIAWETYTPGSDVYEMLLSHFGNKILNADQTINRKVLGEIIFRNEADRVFLMNVVHPAIYRKLGELTQTFESNGIEIFVVEAALLLKSDVVDRSFFDVFVLVKVDSEEQIRRVMARDLISRQGAIDKIASQPSQDDRIKRADFVVDSSGTQDETKTRSQSVLVELRRRARQKKSGI